MAGLLRRNRKTHELAWGSRPSGFIAASGAAGRGGCRRTCHLILDFAFASDGYAGKRLPRQSRLLFTQMLRLGRDNDYQRVRSVFKNLGIFSC